MRLATEPRRRGAPLLALALVMSGWIALRAATWSDWHEPLPTITGAPASDVGPARLASAQPPDQQAGSPELWSPTQTGRQAPWVGRQARATFGPDLAASQLARPRPAVLLAPPRPLPPVEMPLAPRLAGGHALMWLAAVSQLPGPLALLEQAGRPRSPSPRFTEISPRLATVASSHRWSADAWALVRGGGGSAGAAPFGPTYGASQVGAVLRYRLAPGSGHRPTAYLRATAALAGTDREVAAGLSLRPIPQLPIAVAAEGRVGRLGADTVLRPAVIAVSELAPVTLPAAIRAEVYAQGGYVGGRSATAFVDGSLRLDRRVAKIGRVELRAGAGAWGGAQQGAQRLDIGPTATLGVTQGRAAARLALDWRLRVAGDAAPASGPALTISAGF